MNACTGDARGDGYPGTAFFHADPACPGHGNHPAYRVDVFAGWELSAERCDRCASPVPADRPVLTIWHTDEEGTERSDVVFCCACARACGFDPVAISWATDHAE